LSRRESDIGDYGPGVQNGYRGPEGAYSEIPRHVEPRRRVGIFERLAGRVRGAGDSDTRQHDSRDEYAREILAEEFGEGDHDGYDHYPHAADPQEDGRQAPEVPVFFREKRK
jgi:cell division protein FtsZ